MPVRCLIFLFLLSGLFVLSAQIGAVQTAQIEKVNGQRPETKTPQAQMGLRRFPVPPGGSKSAMNLYAAMRLMKEKLLGSIQLRFFFARRKRIHCLLQCAHWRRKPPPAASIHIRICPNLSICKNSHPVGVAVIAWSCWADSNCRPHPYQGCALPPELQQQSVCPSYKGHSWRPRRDLNPRPPA